MKPSAVFVIAFIISLGSYAQSPKNLNLLDSVVFAGQKTAGCWHYNSSSGREYAIVGVERGISIIDITNPVNISLLFQLPGVTSIWHEVKVQGDYAYAVSEGVDPNGTLNGLEIIDLRYLPDSAPTKFYKGDGEIAGALIQAHTITTSGHYAYVNGHNLTTLGQGVLILDITDPWNPVYRGAITTRYCHDSFVTGDTIFTSDIYQGLFSIYDISDKSAPVLLATQNTPSIFNHNTWISDNGRVLYTTDERASAPLAAYDISDFNNISLLDTFYNGNFTAHEVHNVRVLNDFLITPSYGSQLTIVDAARPTNLIEVGSYITGSILCWDADPYTASGNIIATDMQSGTVFLFSPDYIRACYLEGNVTDSITGVSLNNVDVSISSIGITALSDLNGNYKSGYADSGFYNVTFSHSGYHSKTFTAHLSNGVLTTLNVELAPFGAGINSIAGSNVSLFPNPVNDKLHLISRSPVTSWSVYDATGKLILKSGTELIPSPDLSIDLHSLSSGNYTLRTDNAEGRSINKIIRN